MTHTVDNSKETIGSKIKGSVNFYSQFQWN